MSDGQSSPGSYSKQERLVLAMEYASTCRENLKAAISMGQMISGDTDGAKEMVESTIACFNESVKTASRAAQAALLE